MPHGLANELQAVVGPDVGHDLDGTSSGKPPSYADRQALAGGLGPHTEHAKGLAVMSPVMDEVIGPNLVLPLGVQADTGAAG